MQGDMSESGNMGIVPRQTLTERIETEIGLAVSRTQDGITAERAGILLGTSGDPDLPVLRLKVSYPNSQRSVEVKIPVGRADPDKGIYPAGIGGGEYVQYSSPEEIAQAAFRELTKYM